MQEYYEKRAKECEQELQQLKAQVKYMDSQQAEQVKQQIAKVAREMANYRSAISSEAS